MWSALVSLFLGLAQAQVPEERVEVPAQLRQPALPLPSSVRDALRGRKWSEALTALQGMDERQLVGPQRADRAFLMAWALVRLGRTAEAAALLPVISDLTTAPQSYLSVLQGELLHEAGKDLEALAALERVPSDAQLYARSVVVRMGILRDLGRTQDAAAVLQALVDRPDPSPGTAVALMLSAKQHGVGSEASYPLLRRLWTWYPASPEAEEARTLLEAWPDRKPSDAERIVRAERAMDGGMLDLALRSLELVTAVPRPEDLNGCRYAFVKGRTLYKRNTLSEAVAAFGDAGRRCGPTTEDYGARILYIVGQAEQRRGRLAESTAAYRAIAELYPTSTMADDGLTRAGISLAEAGDLAGAMKLWTEALERVPNGDTVPEATFRLAFSHYQQGDPAAAVAVAERLGTLDPLVDAWSVLGGQYWAARWMLYPEVGDPREPVPSGRAEALAGWKALVKAQPQTYYGQLAWSRLKEEDPAAAEALAVRPPPDAGFGPWSVRASFFRNRAVADGVALARLGLVQEAMEEWGTADLFKAQPEEVAWLQELRTVQGDWLSAHKWIQQYMRVKAVGAMGPRSAQIVSVAFPDRYWTDVKAVASGYSYPPRVFHALVREESSFDKDIKSFAGARGLSQVMPATAQEVAGWLGRSVRTDDLYDARLNLTLGSRYLESCFKTHKGNPYLAMASYNGGPARMSGYVRDWGNPPTDEYVERIPIRESREYIKKVATSWQIMRFGFDVEDTPFPDLSAYNHYAWPQ